MDIEMIINACEGFEWDKGNRFKSWLKHGVSQEEADEVFLNEPLLLFDDERHFQNEQRIIAFGHSNDGKCLVIAFTVRKNLIRIISARAMNKKERDVYEKT